LRELTAEIEPLQRDSNLAQWMASVTGREEHAEARARLEERIRAVLARPQPCAVLRRWLAAPGPADPLLRRELEVALNLHRAHQMPAETIRAMVELEKRLDTKFNRHRAILDGRAVADNEIREVLVSSGDPGLRRRAWEAAKQIGREVVGDLLDLVRLRNRAARDQGFASFYSMMLELDEIDEAELFALLEQVDRDTLPLFEAYRRGLDATLARRFGIRTDEIRPWHLGDPFFQEAPSADLDLDRWFAATDVVGGIERFFHAVGFDVRPLLERADLYERPGKSQHAFCLSVDRGEDIRVLCNIRSNETWAGVLLHELGHAVYDAAIDRSLPWLLRTPAHTLTTEASAMLFGRLSRQADWLERYADLPAAEAPAVAARVRHATGTQLLVMSRWCLVMCHMERELYRDPERDLNTLWWDLVERFQRVRRPEGRSEPDWAAKIHFSLAPVYYHNYLLGEIMASQLQEALLAELGGGDHAFGRFVSSPRVAEWLTGRLYRPGKSVDWRGAIRGATGSDLSPRAYVATLAAALPARPA
jgi:peptidyl-dipeptidase A